MHKGFFADTLIHRPLLFRAMLEANRLPERSRVEPPEPADLFPGSPVSDFVSCSEAGRLLSALWHDPVGRTRLLARFHVSHADFWDYAEESRRLALLPPRALIRLARVFGVAVHAPAIARTIKREDVLALRRGLGEELYHYALYRGQYQLGDIRRLFEERDCDVPLPRRAFLHGGQALAMCASPWPAQLQAKVAASVTRIFAEVAAESGAVLEAGALTAPDWLMGDSRVEHALWFALKKLLVKEVASSWAPCFD